MPDSLFIEGPAGVGKTSYAIEYIRNLLNQGVRGENILVLVPQRTLGRPYHNAFSQPDWPSGAQIDVVTLGGLARRGLEIFWPLVAEKAGFLRPELEPQFLTIETSQYYMAGLVNDAIKTGVFDSLSITPFRIMNQILDNLSKAAVNRFPLEEVAERLITAWGDRHSSRPPVYRASLEVAQQFRSHCLRNSLLDFSLQIELYISYLFAEPLYIDYFTQKYRHVIADNLEESYPVVADFVRWAWDALETALLLYDTKAGYRIFLGADPKEMHDLAELCDDVEIWTETDHIPREMVTLADELNALLQRDRQLSKSNSDVLSTFHYKSCKFYPQMLDWAIAEIHELISGGISPREIVLLVPFLSDSLRFVLSTRLAQHGIETVSHRPSRAVRDEPVARAVLTLMALAHPTWSYHPPVMDVADALQQVIEELDPVRAWLLAQVVYRPAADVLGTFDVIRSDIQARITYRAGEKYEYLRQWLAEYEAGSMPPDHFLSRLFGEVLSQPGYGFHTALDAGRVVAELVESAYKFRHTLYPEGLDDWSTVVADYFSLVQEGLLAALHLSSWRDEEKDAVFLVPAHTFLMRNRHVDYQFWLDVGSNYWWERLEQPLTHPYVLTRGYPPNQVWTDEMEFTARYDALRRLVVGLVRRCRKQVYVAISNLGEQGYEQRGPLLQVFQRLIQRYSTPEEPGS
jgi:hypothetical protein